MIRALVILVLAGSVARTSATDQVGAKATPVPQSAAAGATVTLSARSIGSRRGSPAEKRAHAGLLVRLDGRSGGFIVQGGKEPVPGGLLRDKARVVGHVIPCDDPAAEFTRAAGAWWGEPEVRVLPTRDISTFHAPGLTEARIRAIVDELNGEFRGRDYDLLPGPSSNSFVSRFLEKIGKALPPLGGEELPGWGWRP